MFFILLAALLQAPTVTGIKQDIYKQSDTNTVVSTKTYPSSQFLCNQTPPPVDTVTINPSAFIWDDSANAGKVCKITDKAFFDSLAPGDYLGKLTYIYSDGTLGGPSNASNPFTRFVASIPTGVRIVR